MTDAMPRKRPLFLHRVKNRHGNPVWYFRRSDGDRKRVRIRSEYGTPEFQQEYEAALKGEVYISQKNKVRSGSLQWLYDRYRESSAWADLSDATRRQRENILAGVMAKSGSTPFIKIGPLSIEAGKDARASTPSQARNFIDAMRGMFKWAKKNKHVPEDPTKDVEYPKRPQTDGFEAWTEEDVAAYHKRWPLGTKERVWLDVLLYTGPRRGDAVILGRQHVRTVTDPATGEKLDLITFKTEKGRKKIEVTIPILPVLAKTLEAGPTGDLNFIVGASGRPLTKESFGNFFRVAARAAGVNKSAHGVRKIAATTAANNGATVHQMMAIFGWKTSQMAEYYTREANRRRLALDAAHTLAGTPRQQAMDAPGQVVRPPAEKAS